MPGADDDAAAAERALAKAYVPAEFEHEIYERWLAADVFAPDGAGSTADWALEPFVIIQPPPNVTGALHLGHAQRTTVEDLMIRHARMLGRPALFLPGLDHAQHRRPVRARQDPREGGREPRRRWGASATSSGWTPSSPRRATSSSPSSAAWAARATGSRLRFTMDEVSARAVREAFLRLYRKGLAYRAEALVNWCPGCRTSVSDLEVIPTPETGTIWPIRYHLLDDATGEPDPGRDADRGHDAPGDDPGRHGRRRAPRRRALRRPGGPAGPDPVRGAGRAGHRGPGGRIRRSGPAR